MADIEPLGVDQVYRRCSEKSLEFETTDALDPLGEPVGQDRLLQALRFGTGIRNHGFNLFVLGPRGVDRHALVRRFLENRAADEPAPPDWCYVYNFSEPDCPRALRLKAGDGRRLRRDMDGFIEELRTGVAAVFESEEYQSRMQDIQDEFEQRQQKGLSSIGEEANESGIALISTPGGFTLAPMQDGEVLEPDEYEKLPDDEREKIEEKVAELQKKLQQEIQRVPALRKELRNRIRELNEEMILFALGGPVRELKDHWSHEPDVIAHLDAAREHVVENAEALRGRRGSGPPEELLERFRVNLLVDNAEAEGAPVIYEDLPTHHHLVGWIEHQMRNGALYTDVSMIRPGALHRANGGYLILDARRVLSHPMAWESIKRVLFSGDVRIESLERLYGLVSTASLQPENMPVSVKVVLVGERLLYYLLAHYDPDFLELFKVEADFADDIERSEDNHMLYARMLASLAKRTETSPLDRSAVARMIEHASRLADDQRKLTADDRVLRDVLMEAGYWADEAKSQVVTSEHVQRAIDERNVRAGRLRQASLEQIGRGTVMVSTSGETVAQINGLSVIQLGDFRFGRPSRITATARPGHGQVVDIEREVELGGPIHSKGVLILSRFIASRYAAESELSLSGSIVFEQSYGGVDGDSASLAECCVLLSAISGVPLRQHLSVTGSVNQHGLVQAVGGISEKVEGFFDVCCQAGELDGHGVLVPAANVEHLMVKPEVREAVADGRFRIYPVDNVDEALELLTGLAAGELDKDGSFPEDSFNRRVADRLKEFARIARKSRGKGDANGEGDGEENG
ncbi:MULTISPECIES: Lon protease family protein [unclassified Wenzhouxiangella]|uniref:Lon protease family protein n=1 Tax=unclassified Wenzhouxiangella TaxID=2613841 RepID=UPI000E32BE0B|nr:MULTISPECIES: AAA family ATPase [unclassified Wenzhouxiangella]RFF28481.1 ATP-dependent protease [Wenzhouxiangella sp. 15181]RFP69999.1 ATP-dependent protease [Wenzhouxiangella sp. 15190]